MTTAYARLSSTPFFSVLGLGCPLVLLAQPTTCSVFIFSMISSHSRSGVSPLGGTHSFSPFSPFSQSNLYPTPPVRSSSPCTTVPPCIASYEPLSLAKAFSTIIAQ